MSGSEPIAYVRIERNGRKHAARAAQAGGAARGRRRPRRSFSTCEALWSTSAHTALLVADSLLDHGTIGRVRTSHGETTYQADADAIFRGWPMAVLVDGTTSGASEWLAAAIQDNNRAIVVGAPTARRRVNPEMRSSRSISGSGGDGLSRSRRESSSAATASLCRLSIDRFPR